MRFLITALFFLFTLFSSAQGSLSTLTFDGTNDQITGAGGGLSSITNNFTIEMWINPTSTITIQAEQNTLGAISGIAGYGQRYAVYPDHGGGGCPATANNAGIGISAGTNGIQVYEHTGCHMPAILVYNATLPTGWNHIAVVVIAKQPRLYLNGVLVRTGLTSNMTNVFPSANIGGEIYGWFAGSIDEFRIWNISRSQTQLRDNLCKRLIGTETNLVRYYRFDNGAGTTLTDASPSGINGTLTSGPVWATSSAPIGNTVTHNYTTTWTGVRVTHSSPEGDSLSVSAVSSATINAIHIYHVTAVPNITTGITGLGGNDHYYGVFKSFTAGGGGTYTGTYYYRENDAFQLSSTAADPDYAQSNLRVFTRSNNSSTPWTMNATAPNTTTKTITLTAMSTEFILGHVNALANLPVELTEFDAYYSYNAVNLNWVTQTETNNKGFYIQRSSDGINFEDLKFVPGAGNSNQSLNYIETDYFPLAGTSYYRLAQENFNGSITYSGIQTVKSYTQLVSEMNLYPNPTDGAFHIVLANSGEEEVLVVVRDINGKEFYSKVIITSTDQHIEAMDLSGMLPSGIYIITASSKNELYSQKLIVK